LLGICSFGFFLLLANVVFCFIQRAKNEQKTSKNEQIIVLNLKTRENNRLKTALILCLLQGFCFLIF